MLKREELTSERIDQIVADARKAGYHFFLSSEEREASLKEALTRYQPGQEAWVFAYGSLMWNPALEFAEQQPCKVEGWRRSFCFWLPMGRGTPELPVTAPVTGPRDSPLGPPSEPLSSPLKGVVEDADAGVREGDRPSKSLQPARPRQAANTGKARDRHTTRPSIQDAKEAPTAASFPLSGDGAGTFAWTGRTERRSISAIDHP